MLTTDVPPNVDISSVVDSTVEVNVVGANVVGATVVGAIVVEGNIVVFVEDVVSAA